MRLDIKGVGGWLLLLCILLTVIGPLRTLGDVADLCGVIGELGDNLPSLNYALITISVLGIFEAAVVFIQGSVC